MRWRCPSLSIVILVICHYPLLPVSVIHCYPWLMIHAGGSPAVEPRSMCGGLCPWRRNPLQSTVRAGQGGLCLGLLPLSRYRSCPCPPSTAGPRTGAGRAPSCQRGVRARVRPCACICSPDAPAVTRGPPADAQGAGSGLGPPGPAVSDGSYLPADKPASFSGRT